MTIEHKWWLKRSKDGHSRVEMNMNIQVACECGGQSV